MRQYKRRNFFVKKNFQGKLIFGYLLFVTGGCLFLLSILGLFSPDGLTVFYENYSQQLNQTPILLLKNILAKHWLVIVLGTIILILSALLLTHRIAGPLYRFEKTLDGMLARNLGHRIHLRNKDEGKDLALKINNFNQDLSQSIRNLHNHSDAFASLLEQGRKTAKLLPAKEQAEFNSLFWNLGEKNKRIKAICSSYSLMDKVK